MKRICSLLLFIFTLWDVSAQQAAPGHDPYFVETRDTISTRGPYTITRNILQDHNGNFWFASWQGIIKYDGKIFTNFTLKDNLIHFHVLSVFEDSKGNLWFGTVRGGLYRYDGKSFTLYTTNDGLGDNTVICMLEDRSGNLWFGTNSGASRYDPSAAANKKAFTNFTTEDGLGSNMVNSMIQDKTGKLWFAGNSISCSDPSKTNSADGKPFTVFKKDSILFAQPRFLQEDRSGNIWIGSSDGLYAYNGKTITRVSAKPVCYLHADKKGNLWLSVIEDRNATSALSLRNAQVLFHCDPATAITNGEKAFTRVVEKYEPQDCQIFGIIDDKDGNIWFGTMKGACRFDVSRINHPCVQKSCNHSPPVHHAFTEHKEELEKTFTYFTR